MKLTLVGFPAFVCGVSFCLSPALPTVAGSRLRAPSALVSSTRLLPLGPGAHVDPVVDKASMLQNNVNFRKKGSGGGNRGKVPQTPSLQDLRFIKPQNQGPRSAAAALGYSGSDSSSDEEDGEGASGERPSGRPRRPNRRSGIFRGPLRSFGQDRRDGGGPSRQSPRLRLYDPRNPRDPLPPRPFDNPNPYTYLMGSDEVIDYERIGGSNGTDSDNDEATTAQPTSLSANLANRPLPGIPLGEPRRFAPPVFSPPGPPRPQPLGSPMPPVRIASLDPTRTIRGGLQRLNLASPRSPGGDVYATIDRGRNDGRRNAGFWGELGDFDGSDGGDGTGNEYETQLPTWQPPPLRRRESSGEDDEPPPFKPPPPPTTRTT